MRWPNPGASPERIKPEAIDSITKLNDSHEIELHTLELRNIFGYQKPETKNATNEPKLPTVCIIIVNDDLLSKSPGNIPDNVISKPDSINA